MKITKQKTSEAVKDELVLTLQETLEFLEKRANFATMQEYKIFSEKKKQVEILSELCEKLKLMEQENEK